MVNILDLRLGFVQPDLLRIKWWADWEQRLLLWLIRWYKIQLVRDLRNINPIVNINNELDLHM